MGSAGRIYSLLAVRPAVNECGQFSAYVEAEHTCLFVNFVADHRWFVRRLHAMSLSY